MGSLTDYYTAAAAVPPPGRRWAVGAGYALYERVQRFGYPIAAARASILSLPQYADALTAAGLTATFGAVDTFPADGGGSSVLVDDTFTGALDTLLEVHTADTGQSWTLLSVGAAGANHLTGDGCVYRASAPGMHACGSTLATANYQIDLTLNVKSVITGDLVIVGGRTVDNNNLYRAFVTPTTLTLDKLVANVATTLGSAVANTLTTGTHTLSLRMVGDQISLLWDSVVKVGPITDGAYTTAGVPSLRVGAGAVAQTASTGAQADRFLVTGT